MAEKDDEKDKDKDKDKDRDKDLRKRYRDIGLTEECWSMVEDAGRAWGLIRANDTIERIVREAHARRRRAEEKREGG